MSERVALFEELQKGGYEACLATTFNIDFPFYEDVLLRRMQTRGIRHHLLLVDENMCQQALEDSPPVKAGHQYSLAPMACPSAFHPKILLLLGPKKGLLAVGSHNLTLSGFGLNLEVTNVIKYSPQHTEYIGLFGSAFQAFRDWMQDYGRRLPAAIGEALEQTLNLCPWLAPRAEQGSHAAFLYSSRCTEGLWDQTNTRLPERFSKVTALAPFLDGSLSFLTLLAERCDSQPVVGIQQERVKAPTSLLSNARFRTVDLDGFPAGAAGKGYTHAKVLAVSGEDERYLISGSANLTWPAWLAEGDARNAEAMLFLAGETARAANNELSLESIRQAPPATEITTPFETDSTEPAHPPIRTHILPYPDGDWLTLPLDDGCHEVTAYYRGAFGARDQLETNSSFEKWRVAINQLRAGEVLSVDVGATTTIRVILHHTAVLREQTLTGEQQRFKVALGSLNTDSPDMTTFFGCLDKLMKEKAGNGAGLPTAKSRSKVEQPGHGEPDSLIVDQSEIQQRHVASGGRPRAAKGNLALLLDVLVYSTSQNGIADGTAAWGVDRKGRNEEELVNSDDVQPTEAPASEPAGDDSNVPLKDYCQKRCQALVHRLTTSLKDLNDHRAIKPKHIAMSLVIAGVFRQLHRYRTNESEPVFSLIYHDTLLSLTSLLFHQVLWEAQSPNDDSEQTGCEEYGKLLAYATWLAFVSNLDFRQSLPISASQEECDRVHWQNAVMAFLSQRLLSDPQLEKEADRLLADYGRQASDWLIRLLRFGRRLSNGEPVELNGYRLARASGPGFWGSRLLLGEEGDSVILASNNRIGHSRFKGAFLERL